tara:strand:+ start:32800 stop:33828 length:1029 start_codon:yes stop_codon:yes gene_type:complete
MKAFLFALLVMLGVGVASGKWLVDRWEEPLLIPAQGTVLIVRPGQTLRSVANGMQQAGVLRVPQLLTWYGRFTGLDQQIKHGEYQLSPGMTVKGLLLLLQSGKVIDYQVTLPEGITLQAALDILQQQPALTADLEGIDDPRLLAMIEPYSKPEGLFFPDTYHYTRGTLHSQILRRSHQALLTVLNEQWQARADDLPYENAYEALIMASVVERETGAAHERAEIAGVFVRRLERRMRLQTDPTVIYGLGAAFDGNLRRKHLADKTNPYNTYQIRGLPPTPIALAGRDAIHAALHPADGKTLYFVARGDGTHQFSETFAAHQAAVRQYQLNRRQDYRSSPGPAR